jgi:hypothetical protein
MKAIAVFFLLFGVNAVRAVDKIPTLNWPEIPKDWANVKTGCTTIGKSGSVSAAVGDGVNDDTAAIQSCFDLISNHATPHSGNTTVYLPAGTYRVTKSLILFRILGGLIVGQGESTRLVWGGADDGIMLVSDGCSRTRFVGLVLDGQNKAAVGFEHDSHGPGLFETRIRHQNNKFVSFRTAGIRIGFNTTAHKLETSEVLYENSVFDSNGLSPACVKTAYRGCGGAVILNFNDYDNAFDGCHFTSNANGIYLDKMANVYARNSRFEASVNSDFVLAASAGNSIRRCVSVGSRAFVQAPSHTAVNPTTIQDCRVDSWTGGAAIEYHLRGPMLLMDNQFTNGSVPMGSSTPMTGGRGAALFVGNTIDGKAATSQELMPSHHQSAKLVLYDLPATNPSSTASASNMSSETSKNGAVPSSSGLTPASRFLKAWWPVPIALVDARDHGCTGEEADSSACVQATIDAAAKKGGGAAAYFAPRVYKVNRTIVVHGGNFSILGNGFNTQFVWSGGKNNTVQQPAVMVVRQGGGGLRLEQFAVVAGSTSAKSKDELFATKVLHDGSARAVPHLSPPSHPLHNPHHTPSSPPPHPLTLTSPSSPQRYCTMGQHGRRALEPQSVEGLRYTMECTPLALAGLKPGMLVASSSRTSVLATQPTSFISMGTWRLKTAQQALCC